MRENNEKKKYLAPLISVIEVEMEEVCVGSNLDDSKVDDMESLPEPESSYRTTFPGQ